jgi:hypothetical protein
VAQHHLDVLGSPKIDATGMSLADFSHAEKVHLGIAATNDPSI